MLYGSDICHSIVHLLHRDQTIMPQKSSKLNLCLFLLGRLSFLLILEKLWTDFTNLCKKAPFYHSRYVFICISAVDELIWLFIWCSIGKIWVKGTFQVWITFFNSVDCRLHVISRSLVKKISTGMQICKIWFLAHSTNFMSRYVNYPYNIFPLTLASLVSNKGRYSAQGPSQG